MTSGRRSCARYLVTRAADRDRGDHLVEAADRGGHARDPGHGLAVFGGVSRAADRGDRRLESGRRGQARQRPPTQARRQVLVDGGLGRVGEQRLADRGAMGREAPADPRGQRVGKGPVRGATGDLVQVDDILLVEDGEVDHVAGPFPELVDDRPRGRRDPATVRDQAADFEHAQAERVPVVVTLQPAGADQLLQDPLHRRAGDTAAHAHLSGGQGLGGALEDAEDQDDSIDHARRCFRHVGPPRLH